MRRFTVLAAVGLALVVPSSALTSRSANSASFVDPAGDSGSAPDITSVTVSNDDQGVVTFAIGIANRPQLGEQDKLQVIADTDGRANTGDHGFDALVQVEGSTTLLALYNGTRWNRVGANSLESSYTEGLLTLRIDLFDLGAVGDLHWWVFAGTQPGGDGLEDVAPDGTGLYDFAIKVPLLFDRLDTPLTVKAGTTLTASMTLVTDSDAQGVVTCSAKIGAARVTGEPGWLNIFVFGSQDLPGGLILRPLIGHKGYAMCSFKVPKNAKGKLLNGTITAKRSGVVVSRTFSTRIR